MNIKFIFKNISQKLLIDFEISSLIEHNGMKGDFREYALKKFLENGKLPPKYSIGSGLIVSPLAEQSNQSDLIIYDRDKCPVWMYSERVQVFPIEGTYGIIEVKSLLSKQELYDGLKKIENLRRMVPQNSRNIPFCIIFAYKLKSNSLESLQKNLIEYQESIPCNYWANLIVVLEEGIIFQYGKGLKRCLKVEEFEAFQHPQAFSFKKDTLFEFYNALFFMLSTTQLANIDIGRYRELPRQIGKYLVRNYIFSQKGDKIYVLSEYFINKIYDYCRKNGKITYEEVLILTNGDRKYWDRDELLSECYYYDPENLPGIHQVEEPYKIDENGRPIRTSLRTNFPFSYIEIDGEIYYFPRTYVTDEESMNLIEED